MSNLSTKECALCSRTPCLFRPRDFWTFCILCHAVTTMPSLYWKHIRTRKKGRRRQSLMPCFPSNKMCVCVCVCVCVHRSATVHVWVSVRQDFLFWTCQCLSTAGKEVKFSDVLRDLCRVWSNKQGFGVLSTQCAQNTSHVYSTLAQGKNVDLKMRANSYERVVHVLVPENFPKVHMNYFQRKTISSHILAPKNHDLRFVKALVSEQPSTIFTHEVEFFRFRHLCKTRRTGLFPDHTKATRN